MPSCFIVGCGLETESNSTKCKIHRHRRQCSMMDCRNQVYARGLCVKHGGKKQCAHEGCTGNARSGPYCCKHGSNSPKRFCQFHGCQRIAHARHLCVSHGGGRVCSVQFCNTQARQNGFCHRHKPQPFKIECMEFNTLNDLVVDSIVFNQVALPVLEFHQLDSFMLDLDHLMEEMIDLPIDCALY